MVRKKEIKESINKYNELHSPYSRAELIKLNKDYLKTSFEGPFVESCCMDEYFFDLSLRLKSNEFDNKLCNIDKIREEKYVVKFRFK